MNIAVVILWYLIGLGGFVYWWTTEFDLKLSTIPILLFAGLVGPLTWFYGFVIHGHVRVKPLVLIRRRK